MLKGLFGKKKSQLNIKKPEMPANAIDEDETIVINLSGSTATEPLEVKLELPEEISIPTDGESIAAAHDEQTRQTMATSDDDDVTIILSAADLDGAKKPVSAKPETKSNQAQFLAGWLCVRSGNAGNRAYNLTLGRNKVGRGTSNQVCIDIGDNMISQDNHVAVVADPKTKKFYLVPGDSTNLAYLNGHPIMETMEVSDKDVIQVGTTDLILVQYYGNYVDWD